MNMKAVLPALLLLGLSGASAATFSFTAAPTFTVGVGAEAIASNTDSNNNILEFTHTNAGTPSTFDLTTPGNTAQVLIRTWTFIEPDVNPGETNDLSLQISLTVSDGAGPNIGPFVFNPSFVATAAGGTTNGDATITFETPYQSQTFDFGGTSRVLSVRIRQDTANDTTAFFVPATGTVQNFYAHFLLEVPEPASFGLMGAGLLALGLAAYRRTRAA